MGVLFHFTELQNYFEGELNTALYEKKEHVVHNLDIPKYEDPFNGDGKKCMDSWILGNYKKSLKHNRSCLLKEKDILLKRGFREPDKFNFVK
ncbi:MAG: hypothetical protein PHF86_08125 [Candidatus Nanoarchaeia archaeon]|nr:hypothetical protein [Candidatus Nanoarchaeia archaeon]